MSVVSHSLRIRVEDRAGRRCEYCHLPTRGQVATFPVDHLLPRSASGTDEIENLALACPHCNAHKWKSIEGIDPDSGRATRLFNPRTDVWSEHYRWSAIAPGQLIPKSPIGRATLDQLLMNEPSMIALRRLLAELGLFPEALT